jgi:hypothetical protein
MRGLRSLGELAIAAKLFGKSFAAAAAGPMPLVADDNGGTAGDRVEQLHVGVDGEWRAGQGAVVEADIWFNVALLPEFLRDKRNQQVVGWLGGGLVVAVLRYIAGTAWSAKCYMNMRPLYQPQVMQTEAVA